LEYLRQKLVESGWKDELKNYCKELIRNKGLDRITVADLVEELKPRARATVPAKAKEELLARIKNFIENHP
jgi:enhancer of yellow 2 transcription factor